MQYGEKILREGVYVPRPDTDYPMDDPFRRLVTVEVEESAQGKYQFDEHYPYINKSLKYKWNRFIGFFVQWVAVAGINRFKYGLRIEGKEQLRPYRKHLRQGAVAICNHMTQFDAVCAYQALRRWRKFWIPMYAKHFNGSKSWFMIHCGGIPVPETRAGMRKFNDAMDYYHQRREWVLVFPEAVRWDLYQPIRPFRKGAFSMAYRWNCPLVPCAISYRPRTGIYRLFGPRELPLLTLHICEPVLPDRNAARKSEVDRLRRLCHREMEEAVGILQGPWPAIPEEA